MIDYYKFFQKVNSDKATEIEMITLIEEVAKDYNKLEVLVNDVENYRVKIISKEVVKEMFGNPRKPIIISDNFKKFQQLVTLELNKKSKTEVQTKNLHPAIFEDGAFDLFVKWINTSVDESDKKISFIFQKLKKENKLRNTTFKKLSEWAYDNGYLDKKDYHKLLSNGSFISPSKILTKLRLTLYNSILDN